MLQLVYGGAGCGKTEYARTLARETVESGGRPVLIVPEQFSFETERAMLSMLGARNAQKVEIYSFTRLAEKVSRLGNSASGRRLDDCGRVAAMGLALTSLNSQLEYYSGKQPSSNFIEHLLDAVKEFKLCAITPAMLAEAAPHASGTLRRKLTELALIFGAYEAIVAQTALDPMDDLTRLWEQLGEHRFFEGSVVIIDSFRSFTGQEMQVISRIMQQSEKCVITICAENTGDGTLDGLFTTSLKTAESLRATAAKHNIPAAPSVILSKRHRFLSPALASAESGIYRYTDRPSPYTEATDDITIYAADSRYSEMEFCARECRRLLREEGYRCRDIAIIARDEGTYSDLAHDALTLQGIPCFLDRRSDAAACSLMQFVLTALEIVYRGWQCDDILRWLKTGLIEGIDTSSVAELENYCFVWNVKGREWHDEFRQSPEGFGFQIKESDQQKLDRINSVRTRAISLLTSFSEKLTKGTGLSMAAAVYELLTDAGVPEMLGQLCSRLDTVYAEEQAQLWDALMSILDQIASIFGQNAIPRDSFSTYISLMINRCDIGHIPHGLDDVTFGGADRIRVTAPKAVFIVGAVEGEFPATPSSTGVFTDDERRRLLEELDLHVSETFEYDLLDERLMAYNALSAASERLYICYPKGCESGSERTFASECIAEVLKCVPNARQLTESHSLSVSDIEAPAAAFELAARYWNSSIESATLADVLSENDTLSAKLESVKSAACRNLPRLASKESAQRLFGGRMRISSSQAEAFHKCRFNFFCRYGLYIKPRRRAALDSLQFGTVVHYVLEHIFTSLGGESFSSLLDNPDSISERVDELLNEYLEKEMGGIENKSRTFLYQLQQMRFSLTALILNMANELSGSDFQPVSHELEISNDGEVKPSSIPLSDGRTASIIGKIDRVDCWEHNGHTYLRVIDYKTNSKSFLLSDVIEGLNMQMLIYLGEICRPDNGRFTNTVPAGILYCPAYTDAPSEDRHAEEFKIKGDIDSALRRKGLIIDGSDDAFICNAMENGLGGKYIPVTFTQKGTLSKSSLNYLITPTGYEIVGRFVRWKLAQMCGELADGHISPDPVNDTYSPCSGCDYYPVCRYEGELRPKYKGANDAALMEMARLMKEDPTDNG